MRIVFASNAHPSSVAKALRHALASRDRKLSLFESKDLVARMFGYRDWSDLGASSASPGTPFDHLVTAEEASARRAAYVAALAAHGIPADLAGAIVDEIRPTSLPDALPPFDIMSGPQADRLGVSGLDAAVFAGTDGGARLLRAMRAAAADDPHWARRGCLRAHAPDDPWIARTLTDMRAAATHGAWAPLAVLCVAELAALLPESHPHVGPFLKQVRAALAANDAAALGAPLDAAPTPALLSLVAHVEDLLPVLLARHSPFPPAEEAVTPPPVRAPWRRRHPLDISSASPPAFVLPRETLAELDLFAEGMPPGLLLKVVCDRPVSDFREIQAHARSAGVELLRGQEPAQGPLERDDTILAATPDGTVLAGVVIRSRADPAQGSFHVDVAGPFPLGGPPDGPSAEHVEAFLLAAAMERFEDDLQGWGRTIPPGGRLAVFVSPAREATDAFLRRFVHVAGNRHAAAQADMPDLGIDVVIRNATREGDPAPLPDLHLATVPGEAGAAWRRFEGLASDAAAELAFPVVARLGPDGRVHLTRPDLAPLADAVPSAGRARELLDRPEAVSAFRQVVAEAGLGFDASVFVGAGFTAVLSRRTAEDRDWAAGRGICLVVGRRPAEGERERLLNRFWAAFPAELDAILATASERPLPKAHLVAGPSRAQ